MPRQKETLIRFRIADIEDITHDTRQFRFPIPPDVKFEYLPGDHIKIFPDPQDQLEFRPYTPTTTPDTRDHFELIIKRYPNGMVSRFMHQKNIGDDIWMSGPHAGGHFRPGMAKQVGLAAGGTGITPFISMIRTILKNKIDVEVALIFANKSVDDIILKDEFDRYAEEYPNFKRYYMIDHAPPGWTMGEGHIDAQVMAERLPNPSPETVVFVCGPPMMQIELKKKLVESGYSSDKIIFP